MFNLGLEKLQKDRRTDTLKVCWILFKVFSYFSHCWVFDQKGQVLHHLNQPASSNSPPASGASPFPRPWFPGSSIASLQLSMHLPHSTLQMHRAGWAKTAPLFTLGGKTGMHWTYTWMAVSRKASSMCCYGNDMYAIVILDTVLCKQEIFFLPLGTANVPKGKLPFGHCAWIRNHQKT